MASAGGTITFTTTAGKPGNLVIDVQTELEGVPMFQQITPVVTFDSNCELAIRGVLPSGLEPYVLKLQSFAIGRVGKSIDRTTRTSTVRQRSEPPAAARRARRGGR